jgi:hypothetical protein
MSLLCPVFLILMGLIVGGGAVVIALALSFLTAYAADNAPQNDIARVQHIGTQARVAMDRASNEFLRQVYEQIRR